MKPPPQTGRSETTLGFPFEKPKPTGEIKEKVLAVGESITEVTISAWLKKKWGLCVLDEADSGGRIDKATFELPAEAQGILRIVAQEGNYIAHWGFDLQN